MFTALPVEVWIGLILALGLGLLALGLWRGGKHRKLAGFALLAVVAALALFSLVSWILRTWFPVVVK
ncbi:MAG: hypothetical protein JW862_10700 [Anaerolineales bacterium]|nr:hypothetical protein [Anaerolineales bacterium]